MGEPSIFQKIISRKRLLEGALSGSKPGYSSEAPRPKERKEKRVPVRDSVTGKIVWETRIVEE
jgi:hypothetical protein